MIVVPEAEDLVGPFRMQHDPSARLGVPAHITINYPFLPGMDATKDLHQELGELFGGFAPFSFSFHRVATFPNVLYLPPNPPDPFLHLIDAVTKRFPESPPYGGEFDTIVPHLTIACTEQKTVLHSIKLQLTELTPRYLPLTARAESVWLMDNRSGIWEMRASFQLGLK